MSLTAKQLRAAARHARELAMECVNGTAPEFDYNSYCGCAMAVVVKRLHGVRSYGPSSKYYAEAACLDGYLRDVTWHSLGVVSYALLDGRFRPEWGGMHGAVVFPLLALADELENAARQRRRGREI